MNQRFTHIHLLLFYLIVVSRAVSAQPYIISGYVHDNLSDEPLVYALIFDKITQKAVSTNHSGFYSFQTTDTVINIEVSYVGYKNMNLTTSLNSDLIFDFKLHHTQLASITVNAQKMMLRKNEVGVVELTVKEIEQLPTAGLQTDILKSLHLSAGVNAATEGMSNLVVRGGNPDQNLLLVDGIPVYYASHLEGLVSSFNTDIVQKVKLIKGGFSAKYSNRLSSVVDIRLKNGNLNKFQMHTNISTFTSEISAEGPIEKNKSSYIFSLRGFTFKPLIKLFPQATDGYFFGGLGFYDLFAKINRKLSDNDRVFVTLYKSNDKSVKQLSYGLMGETETLDWGNNMFALNWNRQWTNRLFSNVNLYGSNYNYKKKYEVQNAELDISNRLELSSAVKDYAFNTTFEYYWTNNLQFIAGTKLINQTFVPSAANGTNENESEKYIEPELRQNTASAFIETEALFFNNLSVKVGINYNNFFTQTINFLNLVEPRVVLNVHGGSLAFKTSYAIMYQPMHLLSYSGSGKPADLWLPSGRIPVPQKAKHYTAGLFFSEKQFNLSVDAFFKDMENLVTLKENAVITDRTKPWQEKLETQGKGKVYGVEFLFSKAFERANASVSYTYSRSTRQFSNINNANVYLYDYDKTHDLTIFWTHKINQKWSYNWAWYFNTGNPITLPLLHYEGTLLFAQGSIYFQKNGSRLQDYHRFDFSIKNTKNKVSKRIGSYQRVLKLGVYNVYNQQNPYYYYWEATVTKNEGQFIKEYNLAQKTFFPILIQLELSYHI